MVFLGTAPDLSLFQEALREGGKPAAYAFITVCLIIILIRGAILPMLKGFEEAREKKRQAEETVEQARHDREMQMENVRLERDRANALSSVAMKDSLGAAEKIHEMAASVVSVLNQMLESMLKERDRRTRESREPRARSSADQG